MTRIFEIGTGDYADVEMRIWRFLEDGEYSADFSADYIRSRLNGRETTAWGTTDIPMIAVQNLNVALGKLRAWDCYCTPADQGIDIDMIVEDERGNRFLKIKDYRYDFLDQLDIDDHPEMEEQFNPCITDAIPPEDLEKMDSDLEDALDDANADPLDMMKALLDPEEYLRKMYERLTIWGQDTAELDPAELWKGFGI